MNEDKKTYKLPSSRVSYSSSTKFASKPDSKLKEAGGSFNPSRSKQRDITRLTSQRELHDHAVLPSHTTGKELPESIFTVSPYDRTYLEGMVSKLPFQTTAANKPPTKASSNIPNKERSRAASKAPTQGYSKESSKLPIEVQSKTPSKTQSKASTKASIKELSKAQSIPPSKASSKESNRKLSKATKEPSKEPSQDPSKLYIPTYNPLSRHPTLQSSIHPALPIRNTGLLGLDSYRNSTLISQTYPDTIGPSSQPTFKSLAPPGTKSVHTTAKDIVMASRQTMIHALPPSEQKLQTQWAAKTLSLTAACPDAFSWTKIHDGYHCKGTHHLVTDDLIAENKGGVYLIGGDIYKERWGPYYASNEQTAGLLWYAGPEPRPECATDYIGKTDEKGKEWLRRDYREKKVDRCWR